MVSSKYKVKGRIHNFILNSATNTRKKGILLTGFDFFQGTNTSVFHVFTDSVFEQGRGWIAEDMLDRGGEDAVRGKVGVA